MGRLLDEDDVVDWLLKRTEMYDATGHFVDENVVKKNIESQIAKIPSAQPDTRSLEQIKWERDIAIQQLKDLGYSLGEKIRTDGDTISRQALMKEFSDFVRASNNSDFARTPTWNDAVSLVGSMPSAWSTMGQQNGGDTIYRQAAISLPVKPKEDRYFQTQNLDDAYDYGWYSLQSCIERLPSAQPEPYLDSIVSEIENTISETMESGKHHDINVRANGEMICYGLQLALEIIEEKRNERSDIQAIGD